MLSSEPKKAQCAQAQFFLHAPWHLSRQLMLIVKSWYKILGSGKWRSLSGMWQVMDSHGTSWPVSFVTGFCWDPKFAIWRNLSPLERLGQDRRKFKVFHGASEPKKIVWSQQNKIELNDYIIYGSISINLYQINYIGSETKGKSQSGCAHRIAVTTTASFNDPFEKPIMV